MSNSNFDCQSIVGDGVDVGGDDGGDGYPTVEVVGDGGDDDGGCGCPIVTVTAVGGGGGLGGMLGPLVPLPPPTIGTAPPISFSPSS